MRFGNAGRTFWRQYETKSATLSSKKRPRRQRRNPASARLFLDLEPDRILRSRTGGRERGCGQVEHQKVVIAQFGEI